MSCGCKNFWVLTGPKLCSRYGTQNVGGERKNVCFHHPGVDRECKWHSNNVEHVGVWWMEERQAAPSLLAKSAGHLEGIVTEALQTRGMCVVWHESALLKRSSLVPRTPYELLNLLQSISSPPTETYIPVYCVRSSKTILMHLVAGGDVLWERTNGDGDAGTEALKFTFGAAFDQRHNLKQSL